MFIANKLQTHIDNYNDEIITTDGKPPVNAKLTNFKLYGKSVQNGEPAPESPVSIQSVPSSFDIISCGKNLFTTNNWDSILATYNNPFTTITGSNSFYTTKNFGGAAQSEGFIFKVKSNMIYSFSFDFLFEALKEVAVWRSGRVFFYDLTNGLVQNLENTFLKLNISKETGRKVMSVTMPSNCTKIGIVFNFSIDITPPYWHDSAKMTMSNIEFVEGNPLSKYKDYISSTTALNLLGTPNAPTELIGQPIELMSLPDGTADEYRADEGVVIKRVSNVIFGGLESFYVAQSSHGWLTSGNTLPFYVFYRSMSDLLIPKPNTASMCDRFYCYLASKTEDIVVKDREAFSVGHSNYMTIRINKSRLSNGGTGTNEENLQAFKDWLSENNAKIFYELATPITIPVTAQPTPKSVYSQSNNVSTSANIAPTISCGVRKLGTNA